VVIFHEYHKYFRSVVWPLLLY